VLRREPERPARASRGRSCASHADGQFRDEFACVADEIRWV